MTQDNETNSQNHDLTVDALVEHSIALSHVGKNDHIMIVGRKSLGLLFGVCRRALPMPIAASRAARMPESRRRIRCGSPIQRMPPSCAP